MLAENLKKTLDEARTKLQGFGLRPSSVVIRTYTWDGGKVGRGTAVPSDLALVPNPKVREVDGDRLLRVSRITPAYDGGGYTLDQLRPLTGPDYPGVEYVYLVDRGPGPIPYSLISLDTSSALQTILILQSLNRAGPY